MNKCYVCQKVIKGGSVADVQGSSMKILVAKCNYCGAMNYFKEPEEGKYKYSKLYHGTKIDLNDFEFITLYHGGKAEDYKPMDMELVGWKENL